MLPPKAPEHKFWPGNFFSRKNFPPHMCSQNDQRNVGIILSHICWGRTPSSRHGDQGGGGGQMGFRAISPPQSNFLPALSPRDRQVTTPGAYSRIEVVKGGSETKPKQKLHSAFKRAPNNFHRGCKIKRHISETRYALLFALFVRHSPREP